MLHPSEPFKIVIVGWGAGEFKPVTLPLKLSQEERLYINRLGHGYG